MGSKTSKTYHSSYGPRRKRLVNQHAPANSSMRATPMMPMAASTNGGAMVDPRVMSYHQYPVQQIYDKEEHMYPSQKINAASMVYQWLTSVVSTKTPSAILLSDDQLRTYMLPSLNDVRIQYVPTYPHTHGDFGGKVLLKKGGNVQRELAVFKSDREAKAAMVVLMRRITNIMKVMAMSGQLKSVGITRSSPLNTFSDALVHKTFRIGPQGDLVLP